MNQYEQQNYQQQQQQQTPRSQDEVRVNMNARNNSVGMYGNRASNNPSQSGGYYSAGMMQAGSSIGGGPNEQDNRSIASTPSKISKFTYSGQFN